MTWKSSVSFHAYDQAKCKEASEAVRLGTVNYRHSQARSLLERFSICICVQKTGLDCLALAIARLSCLARS